MIKILYLIYIFYKNFNLVVADINKEKVIKKIISKFDIIIPLAALVGAPLCEKNKKIAINKCRINKINS